MSNSITSLNGLSSTFNSSSFNQLSSLSASVDCERVQFIMKSLVPLTMPCIDSEGNQIQL